jgi:hypothetical protein
MGRKKRTSSLALDDDSDDFSEVRVSPKTRGAVIDLMPPEIDDDTDENTSDGVLTIGDGCFLTQQPSGYGPDF